MQIRILPGKEWVHKKKKKKNHCVQIASLYNKELIIKLIWMACG